jgi:hypothetical protein
MPRHAKSRPEKPELWKVLAAEELRQQWVSYSGVIRQGISQSVRDNPGLKTTLPQD